MLMELRTQRAQSSQFEEAVYVNNPNFVKRKTVVYTLDVQTQTEDDMKNGPISESEIENRIASKLVKMLLSKGVNKIIKKYGYLPVDYINKSSANTDMTTLMKQSNTPMSE